MAVYCPECGRGSWACACGLSYAEKLKGIQISAGAKTFKKNYIDTDALSDQFGNLSENKDILLERTKGIGYLKWSGGRPYRKNRQDGSWEPASNKDTNELLGLKEEDRSFGFSAGRQPN